MGIKIIKCALVSIVMVLLLFGSHTTQAYSAGLQQFIRAGKVFRFQLNEGYQRLIFLPEEENLRLWDPEQEIDYTLQKGNKYLMEVGIHLEKKWSVQVFASSEKEKARGFCQDLSEAGYQNVYLKETDKLYKVRVGKYNEKSMAEETAGQLQQAGWSTWIVADDISSDSLQLLLRDAESAAIVFHGESFRMNGQISLNQEFYRGEFEFLREGDHLFIYNTVGLQDFISGIMAEEFSGNVKLANNNQGITVMQVAAVITRTDFLARLLSNQPLDLLLNRYHGLSNVSQEIRQAVSSTTGMVLQQQGKYAPIVLEGNEISKLAGQGLSYQEVLHQAYPGLDLVDLKQMLVEDVKVNATVLWGLSYKEIRQLSWWGPRVITILDLDLERKGYVVETVLAEDKIAGLEDLTDLVEIEQALAGINGGFFHYSGRPLGLLMKDGLVISEPIKNRTALGITSEQEILIDQLAWRGLIQNNIGVDIAVVTGVNRPTNQNEAVIFNRYYGEMAPALEDGISLLVINQEIIDIQVDPLAGQQIPEGGFVLQARGESAKKLAVFKIGDIIIYKDDFTPDWEEQGVIFALGAGPRLIKDGQIFITANQEEFQADITMGSAPRSALGVTADNRLLFFTVDGRQPQLSTGISLHDLASLMLDYGVVEGMNLDGGASARMVVRKFTMNNPSSRRLISNGLLIKYRR